MDATALDLLKRLGEEGRRRFAGWDAPRFEAYCRGVLPALWARLPPGSGRTFEGLSALVQQGIGDGYLHGDFDSAPGSLLEFCLREWLPDVLGGVPAEDHLPLLARVWNLGEGLSREAEWVNAYVMSRIGELRAHDGPEAFLVDVLRPLLEPAPAARWDAPYRVTMLSLRAADDEFLPGEMQLAAPSVLVVADRLRPVRLGVHLRRDGRSSVLGTFGPTGPFPEEPSPVRVTWIGGTARIGDHKVVLPLLAGPFRWSLVRAGYVIASAADSQKLWIVESAA